MKEKNGFLVPEPGEFPDFTKEEMEIDKWIYLLKEAPDSFNLFQTVYFHSHVGSRQERQKRLDEFKAFMPVLISYELIEHVGNTTYKKTKLFKLIVRNGGWYDYKIKIHQGKPIIGDKPKVMEQNIQNNDFSNNKGNIVNQSGESNEYIDNKASENKPNHIQLVYWIIGIISAIGTLLFLLLGS